MTISIDRLQSVLSVLVVTTGLIGMVGLRSISAQEVSSSDWPAWRGPNGTGAVEFASPPTEWSASKNVRWKTRLPGRGHSTPVVWGDHVFVTTASPVGTKLPPRQSGRPGEHDNLPVDSAHQFVVLAIDRVSGRIRWQTTVHQAVPVEGAHYTASLASASPVTDGRHVYASFGSHGLYCLDFAGNIVWSEQFGTMHTKHGHGEGSSPALYGDSLVINWDHEEQSSEDIGGHRSSFLRGE